MENDDDMGGQYSMPPAPSLPAMQANQRTMVMDKYTIAIVAKSILEKYVGKDTEVLVTVERRQELDQYEMAVSIHRHDLTTAPIFREPIDPMLKGFPSDELIAKLMLIA